MSKQKVLVVEDEPDLRRGYTRLLETEGYDISQAASGEEALRAAREVRPDLILLDVMLPDADGVEVCRRLKADEHLRDTFVIMLSGLRTTAEHQAEAVAAGADGYLAKPIEPTALKAHVLAFLRIRQNEEDLRASERRYREQAEELREANRRLEEYNRLKAEFVANMSHELRTPLTAIIGFAQLAQLTRGGDEMPKRYADAFERILRNGQHLLALINDVLDVSKIEAGRMKIHREHVDLVEVVQGAFAELQSLAERKGLEYRLRVHERLPLAYTDPLRVRQVLINLLSNAAKFTARGRVEAELLAHGDRHFRIVVRDTGIGIEERSLPIIFERFRQVDGSMTRAASGVGLGLSIVRQIVDLLGGEIEVTSKVGEGSTFTVTLPLDAPAGDDAGDGDEAPQFAGRQEGAAPAPSGQGAQEIESDDERAVVVVVEDDEDAAALLSKTLERSGYRVLVAGNGAEGLRLAREHDPVAVTLDVMMPEMDGWRVLQAMRADRRLASIPVIVCSIVDNRPLGYSLGASDYLLKPVDPQALTDMLDRVSVRGVPSGAAGDGDGYVLVVDDEHGVRELLTTALRHAGFNARSAPSGETALKMAVQRPPRAVLCDLMMPNGMSGFELIARLRSDPQTAALPVIVVTGKDVTPEDRRLFAGEIAEVIRKGELLLSDVASRLRQTLEELGVEPTDGEDSVR